MKGEMERWMLECGACLVVLLGARGCSGGGGDGRPQLAQGACPGCSCLRCVWAFCLAACRPSLSAVLGCQDLLGLV